MATGHGPCPEKQRNGKKRKRQFQKALAVLTIHSKM